MNVRNDPKSILPGISHVWPPSTHPARQDHHKCHNYHTPLHLSCFLPLALSSILGARRGYSRVTLFKFSRLSPFTRRIRKERKTQETQHVSQHGMDGDGDERDGVDEWWVGTVVWWIIGIAI